MSNSPTGGGSPTVRTPPSPPRAGVSFAVALKVEKKISASLSLHSGFQYNYLSTVIKTGMSGDTAGNIFFPGMAQATTRYYRTGATATYRNNFNIIAVPFAIRYQALQNVPLYLDAGMTIGRLLSTNALLYSSQNSAYATDDAVFNKWLVSATGGLGIHLFEKRKLPLTLGYRFGYTLNSVTKTTIARQHLANSTLYLGIPLKK